MGPYDERGGDAYKRLSYLIMWDLAVERHVKLQAEVFERNKQIQESRKQQVEATGKVAEVESQEIRGPEAREGQRASSTRAFSVPDPQGLGKALLWQGLENTLG